MNILIFALVIAGVVAAPYALRDLWTKQSLGTTKDVLNAEVPSHDVLMVRLEKLRK